MPGKASPFSAHHIVSTRPTHKRDVFRMITSTRIDSVAVALSFALQGPPLPLFGWHIQEHNLIKLRRKLVAPWIQRTGEHPAGHTEQRSAQQANSFFRRTLPLKLWTRRVPIEVVSVEMRYAQSLSKRCAECSCARTGSPHNMDSPPHIEPHNYLAMRESIGCLAVSAIASIVVAVTRNRPARASGPGGRTHRGARYVVSSEAKPRPGYSPLANCSRCQS